MRILPFIFLIFLSFSSCKSTRHVQTTHKSNRTKTITSVSKNSKADNIINYAITFSGTRYKYGGTTNKGMDCSGLIYISFKKEAITLPRVSRDMAKQGQQITLQKAKKGDLLFFKTSKNGKDINHVGLIVNSENGNIKFIHATTSKGVITSSLSEPYWKLAFIEVRQIL
ncbi:Probable lipoprotein NlpC [hydrothermal vent metagenome]|jgi:probable lipoprotein NlpC|uniref:Probable lipoprotein NlpC n=1 Tax=hydrothermal vent metagenome TaxID=652676 RepID=A0A3B0QZ58_9ZZZZ